METTGQSQTGTMVDAGSVVLDIESLTQSSNQSCGSPKFMLDLIPHKALSRKGSCRMERRSGEDIEMDEASKCVLLKNSSLQQDQPRQLPSNAKASTRMPNSANNMCSDGIDSTRKRFSRFQIIQPKRILLLFATMSSLGTMILIYFTLAINQRNTM